MGKSNFPELVGKVKAGAKSAAKKVMPENLIPVKPTKDKADSYNKTTKGTESNRLRQSRLKDEPPKIKT